MADKTPVWMKRAVFVTRYGAAVTVPTSLTWDYQYIASRAEMDLFLAHVTAVRDQAFPVTDEGAGS